MIENFYFSKKIKLNVLHLLANEKTLIEKNERFLQTNFRFATTKLKIIFFLI